MVDNLTVVNLIRQCAFGDKGLAAGSLCADVDAHLNPVARAVLAAGNRRVCRHVRVEKLQKFRICAVSASGENDAALGMNDYIFIQIVLGMEAHDSAVSILNELVGPGFNNDLPAIVQDNFPHGFDEIAVRENVFIDMSDAPAVQFCGRVANNLYAAVGEPFDIFAGTFNKTPDHNGIHHVMAVCQKICNQFIGRVINLILIREFCPLAKGNFKHHEVAADTGKLFNEYRL